MNQSLFYNYIIPYIFLKNVLSGPFIIPFWLYFVEYLSSWMCPTQYAANFICTLLEIPLKSLLDP